jgi:hypothetical protein
MKVSSFATAIRVVLMVVYIIMMTLPCSIAANNDVYSHTKLIIVNPQIHTITAIEELRGGGWIVPAGWNPLGYKITPLGEEYLSYDGSLDSDVGRFVASLKSGRKRFQTIKDQWLEVLRVSKTGQSMRIYKQLQDLLNFCLKAGLID